MPFDNLWFRHEYYARSSPKLTDLKMEMKMEGVGIYWCLIEFMYEQNGYINESSLKAFCYNEHLEIEKVKKVLQLAKFKFDKNKGYYANGVLERISKREEFCAKQKEKADKRWEKEKQKKQVSKEQEQVEENNKKKDTGLNELFDKVYDEISFNKNKEEKLESLRKLKENK